jgi:hypothetical protein
MRIILLALVLAGCERDPDTIDGCTPFANAGGNTQSTLGLGVCLDAGYSSCEETHSYTWSFEQIPAESALDDTAFGKANGTPAARMVCFTPDVVGTYVVSLIVSDGTQVSGPDLVVIDVTSPNQPPVASCEPPEGGRVGELLAFDGSASSDPDGQRIAFEWSLARAPDESVLTTEDIYDRNSAVAHLVPDAAGTWTLALVVDDGQDASAPCQATVEVDP